MASRGMTLVAGEFRAQKERSRPWYEMSVIPFADPTGSNAQKVRLGAFLSIWRSSNATYIRLHC